METRKSALSFEALEKMSRDERRKHLRADVRLSLAIHRRPSRLATIPGSTIDLSPFGMKALIQERLDDEEVVEIDIDLPGGIVRTGAVVVRCLQEGFGFRVSFAFYRLDLAQFTVLRDYVARVAT